MTRIVPGKTNQRLPIVLKYNIFDLICLFIGAGITLLTAISMMLAQVRPFWIIIIPAFVEVISTFILLTPINESRIYNYVGYMIKYLFANKKITGSTIKDQLGVEFVEDYIKSQNGYSKIIRIKGYNFDLISEEAQDQKINLLANTLSVLSKGKIVKLDTAINFKSNIDDTVAKLTQLSEEYEKVKDKDSLEALQLEARIALLSNDKEVFESLENEEPILTNDYFLILYNLNKENLDHEIETALNGLNRIGCPSYCLNNKENKEFYMNFFDLQDQKDNLDNLKLNDITEKSSYLQIKDRKYCVSTLIEYPFTLGNAWLSYLTTSSDTKVIVNFSKNIDTSKTIKRVNKKIVSLGGMLLQRQTESDKLEIQGQIEAYQSLLEQLKFSKETLHIAEIMIITNYDRNKLKSLNDTVKTSIKCKIDPLHFRQEEAYSNCLPHIPTKDFKDLQRDFQSTTLAGSFPFISDLFIDKKGQFLGNNTNPVFFDMFYNLNNPGSTGTRTNANIMTIGASGKGKSYLTKSLIMNRLIDNTKVFILDPENEYSYIASMFGGDVIDVSGGSTRINPFEVFPELDDEGKVSNDALALNKHYAFLADFFKVVIPDITPYTRQTLNNLMPELYASKKIFNYGYEVKKDGKTTYYPLSTLTSKDYPLFSDLIKLIEKKDMSKCIQQDIQAFTELKAYLQDFSENGRFGLLWNGPTTLNVKNDFVVFNFRSLESGSSEIRNGQMLLITKFLMKEIINNYQKNLQISKTEAKKVVLAVDEAHVFIDPKFPVALDMMASMAKRIRKYSGSLWVATQNIADFIGGDAETIKKASAVMNNCQYTFLFGLKPNDLVQVKDMYSKSASTALTEEEVGFLSNAGQGDALLLVDETTRVSFHVALKDKDFEEGFIKPFENKTKEVVNENSI